MPLDTVPDDLRELYEFHERRHAVAILATDFSGEWNDIIDVLRQFRLYRSQVLVGGGSKSAIAGSLDQGFYDRGWAEKQFESRRIVDEEVSENPTHKIDCYRNRVGLEVEWSNKDPFYDRDLNNFRILFELGAISVGVIITKSEALKEVFKELGVYPKYGASTTWMGKLIPRIEGGGAGGCPLLVIGIGPAVFVDDSERPVHVPKDS